MIEIDAVARLIAERDLVLTVERGVGPFVTRGGTLASLGPPERADQKTVSRVRESFKIGQDRTHQQDVEYGIYQLVDIAVRSLSPSFNAVTTASTRIDDIGSILRQLAPMELPPRRRFERDGKTRVIVESPTFDAMLKLGFDQIRTFGEGHQVILIHLLEVVADLAAVTTDPDRRRLLVEHANHIAAADRSVAAEVDRKAIAERLRGVGDRLRDAGVVDTIASRPQ